jgi:hypothetical protein
MPYPAVGSGLAAQILAVAEGTYGVAPSLAAARSYEFKSETLELKKNTVQGEGLAAGHLYDRTKRRVLTTFDVNGSITMDLPTRQLAYWLQFMVGSFGQSLATPAQISSSGIYQSVHQGIGGIQTTGGLLGHSMCIQKGVPDVSGVVDPFTYVGVKVSDWELKCATSAIAELTLTLDARNELGGAGNTDPLNVSVPALQSWAGPPTSGLGEGLFHFREATVYTGGTPTNTAGIISLAGTTAAGNVKDVDIKHTVKFDNARYFLGSSGFKAEQIENGFRSLTGSFTIEWLNSEAMYNAYAADTTTSLELNFVGPTVGGQTYLLQVIIPNIKLDGESPKVSGPAVVTQSVSFTGLDDEATVPIQIIYQSEDTAI